MTVELVTDRQPEFEREFLKGAERAAGLDNDWAARVESRLARMERAKGHDSYKQLGLRRILIEIEQEALDLGGWPVLAALVTYGELDDETGHEARMLLQAIAAHGVRVKQLVDRVRDLAF